jgi:type I restriction enzyme S subunit
MRMSKQEKKRLVPERRFPEFRDVGEWQVTKLKHLAKRTMLRNVDCCVTRVLTNSAEFGVVDQRDFFDKDIANQGNLDGYYVVEQGDYVYNPRVSTLAPVGPISKNKIGIGVMSPLYTVFRFDNSNNEFFEHYFKTAQWHTYMRFVSNSGARHDRMAITADDFMDMPLPAPKSEEQQKIADCLTSLDDLINAQTQKLDALKTHKKGLMQQLFPAEGETVPKLRFPEFRNKGEWTVKELGEFISTITPPKKLLTTDYLADGRFPVIDQSQSYICGWTNDDDAIIDDHLPLIVFGDHTCILKLVGQPFAQGADGIKIFKPNNSAQTEFLYQSLQFKPLIMEQYKRHFSILRERKVAYPDRKTGEQQKIADCLTSIDELITAQSQKLDALKTHKKGLMQQLFPAMDEVAA